MIDISARMINLWYSYLYIVNGPLMSPMTYHIREANDLTTCPLLASEVYVDLINLSLSRAMKRWSVYSLGEPDVLKYKYAPLLELCSYRCETSKYWREPEDARDSDTID